MLVSVLFIDKADTFRAPIAKFVLKNMVKEKNSLYHDENITKYVNKKIMINITNLDEEQKGKLRTAIRYYTKPNALTLISVIDNNEEKPCGKIYTTNEVYNNIKKIVGNDNISLV